MQTHEKETRSPAIPGLAGDLSRADDEIRTRYPHLGKKKVMQTVPSVSFFIIGDVIGAVDELNGV